MAAEGDRRGFWRRLAGFRWGEAALWLAFVMALVAAIDNSGDRETAVTLAGVLALAAIGVRATRPDRSRGDA